MSDFTSEIPLHPVAAVEEPRPPSDVPETQATAPPPSLLGYPATYALIGINLAVYLVMFRFGPLAQLGPGHPGLAGHLGVSDLLSWVAGLFTAPFGERVLTYFGGCTPDRVLAYGQWWRLITSLFVHVTLLHLLLNMWCLWNLGLFGEPLLGKPGLVAVYLLTGSAGMLQSVLLSLLSGHIDVVVAGASGAVFGMAGILIVLLSNRKLAAPWAELRSLRRQVIFFAAANLLLGGLPGLLPRFSPGLLHTLRVDPASLPNIDNSAHLGGLVCGFALGFPLFPRMTSGRSSYRTRQVLVFGTAALVLALLGYAVAAFARSLMG